MDHFNNNKTDYKGMSVNITGIKVGRTDITSTYIDNVSQSDSQEFTVTAVSLGSVSEITDHFVYDGSEIQPRPLVYAVVNGQPIELHEENGDYTLSYSDNKNAGTATVTVTGQGNFTGTIPKNFIIHPRVVELEWGQTSWTYDGNEHRTTCEVSNLVSGDSCTVTLTGNSITNLNESPVTVTATGLSNPNYTLVGASNTSVELTLKAGMFVKLGGIWTPVKSVYQKVNGSWTLVQQQDYSSTFSTSKMYMKKN